MNMMTRDGFSAKIEYSAELDVFRAEMLGLSGGADVRPTPNPFIELTRSGSAGLAFISFWAKPAPPTRAAHVKR